MKIRNIKNRLDRRNGRWLRWSTPKVRGGITYIENIDQAIRAFGSPYPGVSEHHEQQPARIVRFSAHIKDIGEIFEFSMRRANVDFEEVDKSSVLECETGNLKQMWGRVNSRQNISISLDLASAKELENGMVSVRGTLVNADNPVPSVNPHIELSTDRTHVSLNLTSPYTHTDEACAIRKAADVYLEKMRSTKPPGFIEITDTKMLDKTTMQADIILRPGSDAEMEIVERIKESNPNTYSMRASVKKDTE